MASKVYTKRSLLFLNKEMEYHLSLPSPGDKERYYRFAWDILRKLLPPQAVEGGVFTDLKGLSYNDTLLTGLSPLHTVKKDLMYLVGGTAEVDVDSENESEEEDEPTREEFQLTVFTEFSGFKGRTHIAYKPNILPEGAASQLIRLPVYNYKNEPEVTVLFAGMEFFSSHTFHLIGFAPESTATLLIQGDRNEIKIRLRALKLKKQADFFKRFGGVAEKLQVLLLENFSFDLRRDLERQTSGYTRCQ